MKKKTIAARAAIGFKHLRERWKKARAEFTAHNLVIEGHPVMEDWEEPYMRALAQIAGQNGGRVLEIGFGLGLSAGFLQAQPGLKEHWVIEANQEVCLKAKAFAAKAKAPVRVLPGFWEEVTPRLPDKSLDGILFDTYPLAQDQVHCNHFGFFPEAHRLLRPGGVFTYYSDEPKTISQNHLQRLRAAGFSDISWKVCRVKPPAECLYWQKGTLVVPIVRRGK